MSPTVYFRHVFRRFLGLKKEVFVIALIVSGIAVIGYSQEDVAQVNDPGFKIKQRPPVAFYHDEHNDKAGIEDCSDCHHVYDEDGNQMEYETSEDRFCSDCHLRPGRDSDMDLTRIYHLRCKGCHVEQKSGPVMCGECHRKPR